MEEGALEKAVEIGFQIKGEQPEVVIRQNGVEMPGMDRARKQTCELD